MGMTQTKTYRNPTTGYTVTLTDNGRGARVTTSDGFDFPMVGADYPFATLLASSRAHLNGAVELPASPAPAQMTSPLAPDAQVSSARPLAAGATLTMPTLPQARCLSWATTAHSGMVRRGVASVTGQTAPLSVLVAMVRRGWFEWPTGLKMQAAALTDTGRRALAAYVAKHGQVL